MFDFKFPLVPDRYHLKHVGRTKQGNGFWITTQLVSEGGQTRDFVAAYVFDPDGALISADVRDMGLRTRATGKEIEQTISRLKTKIDAAGPAEIWVRPFSVLFYGHAFGLVVREPENGSVDVDDAFVDALPGHTLMFYGPWDLCNYDT